MRSRKRRSVDLEDIDIDLEPTDDRDNVPKSRTTRDGRTRRSRKKKHRKKNKNHGEMMDTSPKEVRMNDPPAWGPRG